MSARGSSGTARAPRRGAPLDLRRDLLSPRRGVAEHQRARLLAAAVAVIDERGYAGSSVTCLTACARISRGTFYDLFDGREDCLLAVLSDAVERVEGELAAADLDGLLWRERVRTGLWTILGFFDREPALARVCVVESARGGPGVLAFREELYVRLAGVLAEGNRESARGEQCPPLVAEGLVGAACSILYTRLSKGERGGLVGLLNELMAMIVLPYRGRASAARELERPAPEPIDGSSPGASRPPSIDFRLTHRTQMVLVAVAELGGRGVGPNNREVSDAAQVADQGQISKLLARLEGLGLLTNTGGDTQGIPRAWQLTPKGEEIIRAGRPQHGKRATR
jgi:AcrR family transcriptional regulator/DNA-binding MarR family transcriptional regulator